MNCIPNVKDLVILEVDLDENPPRTFEIPIVAWQVRRNDAADAFREPLPVPNCVIRQIAGDDPHDWIQLDRNTGYCYRPSDNSRWHSVAACLDDLLTEAGQ